MKSASLVPLLILGCLTAATAMRAQSEQDLVITPTRGFHPAHSYSISDVESIDAATGALSLHIPITELPAGPAGFTAGLSLVYHSRYWETYPQKQGPKTFYTLVPSTSGGWQLSLAPKLEVIWFENPSLCFVDDLLFQLRVVNPDGSSHVLLLQGATSSKGTYCLETFVTVTTPTVWHSIDGSFLQLTLEAPDPGQEWQPDTLSWTLSRNDGSTVAFDVAQGQTYLRDRNGNTITIERGTVVPGHNYEEMRDPFGRTIRIDYYLGDRDEVTQTGHDGDTQNPLQWTVRFTPFPPFTPPTDDYWCVEHLRRSQWVNACSFVAGPALVSSLELPNGLSYGFAYGSPVRYGELKQMALPSGATVDYSYRLDSNPNKAIYFEVLSNWVKTKAAGHDGTSESWQYDYNSYGNFGAFTNSGTVTAPDGGVTQHDFYEISYYLSRPRGGILQKITQPDGSTLERDWDFNFPVGLLSGWPNPWVQTETETRANASGVPVTVYRQVFTSDKNGNITSREEHDSATLLRKTVTTYVNGATDSTNLTETDPNAYTHAAATSPRDLVELQEVQDPLNPQSPVVSRSEFDYQESVPNRMAGNLVRRLDWDSEKPGTITPCTSPTVPGSCGLQLSATNSAQEEYTYTQRGNFLTAADPNGNPVTYSYASIAGCPDPGADSSDLYRTGRQQGGVSSVLLQWTYEYQCISGLREQVTDPNGLAIATTYDRYGRPTMRAEGTWRDTRVTYNDPGRWIVTQDDVAAAGDQRNVRVARFDQLGRLRLTQQLEQTTTPAAAGADESLGIKTETRYRFTPGINAVLVSNPYRGSGESTNGWTAARRDTAGRVCAAETFLGPGEPALAQNCAPSAGATGTTSYGYAAAVAWTQQTITDPAGATRVLQSGVMGRLLAVVDDPGGENLTTSYAHDLQDNLTGVTQGTTTRSFAYSSLSRLLEANNPENGTISYSYDNAGNLLGRTTGGVTRTSTYDDQYRLLTQSYNDGTPTATHTYDTAQVGNRPSGCSGDDGPKGRLASVSSGTFSTFYFHSRLGHTVCSRQTVQTYDPFDFLYFPTPQGEWATVEYPSGRTLATAFDDAGRPVSVAGASAYATGLQYAPHGAARQVTLGNGTVETADYNAHLQLTDLKLGSSAGASDRWRFENGYPAAGNNGNVLSQTVTVLNAAPTTTHYGYDGLNRLKLANEEPTSTSNPVCPDAGSHWCQQYAYDARGNRRVEAESYLALAIGRPDAFGTDNRIADPGFAYDARGNLALLPTGERYLYDGENRQVVYCAGFVSAADCSNPAVTLGKTFYYYDGEGRRVGKLSGAVTQVFVYDARGRLAAEYGGSAEVSGTNYVTADHLGTTRVITDASKAVLMCKDYLPFGDELLATAQNGRNGIACYSGETGLRQKFTGKERDPESRLDYFGARYYSWAQGRFTSPDAPLLDQFPEDPQSWNLYAYVRNNPVKHTDPNGRSCLDGLSNCANYLVGGLKALGNIPTDAVNLPNRLADTLLAPVTDFRFGDVLPTPFAPSNFDQQQGMEAASATMLVSPFVDLAASRFAATGGRAAAEAQKAGVRVNRAVGEAFRDEVATALAKEGRGVQTEVYKKTPFGPRKIDIEVRDKPGGNVLGGIETKTGNSRYRASQRAKDEYLKRQRGYPVNVARKPKPWRED